MLVLFLGLILFLGAHSVRIVAGGWRDAMMSRLGENAWKGLYSVVSLVGLVLIVWGYGEARLQPTVLWASPTWTRHLAALLVLIAFVLLAAAYVPRNNIRYRLHHPMVLSVKVWAIAHLLANNTLADVLLFGAFLAWAVVDFRSARLRDAASSAPPPVGRAGPTVVAVIIGVLVWAAFVFWAHRALMGVAPFPSL
jgi:uncharacterized membrane protein